MAEVSNSKYISRFDWSEKRRQYIYCLRLDNEVFAKTCSCSAYKNSKEKRA